MGAPTSLNTTSNQSSLNTTSNQSPAPFSPGPSCEWLKHLLAVELAPLKSQVTDLKTANESLESRVTDLTSQMEALVGGLQEDRQREPPDLQQEPPDLQREPREPGDDPYEPDGAEGAKVCCG